MQPPATWQPYRESLRFTLIRTVAIAVVVGGALAWRQGGMVYWPLATLLVLWPSFGGHWVEIAFLNGLRPRLPMTRAVQVAVRMLVWFVGGIIIGLCVRLTAIAVTGAQPSRWPAWWIAGLVFIGVELTVHLVLALSGRPSFYNGRG